MSHDSETQTKGMRMLLGKQPARTLLVDTHHPLSTQPSLVDDLCESIKNVFSIACNVTGPTRFPLFSLFALSAYPEMLLPLSYVKNNYGRIQTACEDLREFIHDSRPSDDRGCVIQALREACSQFRRQALGSAQQSGGFCVQLEIIIITCRKAVVLQRQIEEASPSLDLESLKRIQVVSLSNIANDIMTDPLTDDLASQCSSLSNNSGMTGLVDTIQLDTDPLCLQNFFSNWLLDTGTDSEHLHVILPPSNLGNPNLVVKCDLHERILDPAQLPFFPQFTLHQDSASRKTFPSTSKALGMSIPVFKIVVTCLMPAKELCDSVVFGMPLVVQPTACWKIDWDDLEKNQQVFRSLCRSLLFKNLIMIGQMQDTVQVNTKRQFGQPEDKPQGYFVFLPCDNGTMLVKSIAVQELLLPFNAGPGIECQSDDVINLVDTSLEKLEMIDTFNPLSWTSRLYECLKSKYKKSDSKQSKKSQPPNNMGRQINKTPLFRDQIGPIGSQGKVFTPVQPQKVPKKSKLCSRGSRLLPFPTDL